jgi:predicted DNA-binding protein with PD1-like motif
MSKSNEKTTVINLKDNWWYKVRIPSGKKLMEGLKEAIEEVKKSNSKVKYFSFIGLGGGLKNVEAYLSQCEKIHGSNPKKITLPNPGGPGIYEMNGSKINVTTLEDGKEQFIHCHASLTGGEELEKSTGGHIVDADVELTVELDAFVSEVDVLRGTDEETGLPLKLTSKGIEKSSSNRWISDGWIIVIAFMVVAIWLSVMTFVLVKKNK